MVVGTTPSKERKKRERKQKSWRVFGTIYEFLSDFKNFNATNSLCKTPPVDNTDDTSPSGSSNFSYVVDDNIVYAVFLLFLFPRSEELRSMTSIGPAIRRPRHNF